jgi:hypothetical protein
MITFSACLPPTTNPSHPLMYLFIFTSIYIKENLHAHENGTKSDERRLNFYVSFILFYVCSDILSLSISLPPHSLLLDCLPAACARKFRQCCEAFVQSASAAAYKHDDDEVKEVNRLRAE